MSIHGDFSTFFSLRFLVTAMAQSGRSLSDSAARPGRNDVTIKVTLLDGDDKTLSIDVSVKKTCR